MARSSTPAKPPQETAPAPEASLPSPIPDTALAYDTRTKRKLGHPVPASWLDGRFPHLKQVPSQEAGN